MSKYWRAGVRHISSADEPMGHRRLCAVGLEHGRDAPDLADPGRRPWPRPSACQGLGPVHIYNRSGDLADIPIVFKPGTDLAILNYIASHIIATGRVNRDFVDKHTSFFRGATQIGYRLRPDDPRAVAAKKTADAGAMEPIDFTAYAAFVKDYTLEKVAALSGVDPGFLEQLAELYADPKRKVVSFWTMGFNQHVRGVWANHLIYNLRLLTGKIAEPGNSPFSLTGQPSACGTAREVGTFAHRLPADMVVVNREHRKHAESNLGERRHLSAAPIRPTRPARVRSGRWPRLTPAHGSAPILARGSRGA